MSSALRSPVLVASGAEAGRELFARASVRLRRTVPFDAAGWFAVDPATLLPTSPVLIENVEQGNCEDYWERENTVADVLPFRDLARAVRPTGSLLAATADNPLRSARFREYLASEGYVDELRSALRIGETTWAVAVLLRGPRRRAFSAREAERVTAFGPQVAAELAALAVAGTLRPAAARGDDCPGIAVFGPLGALFSADDQARRWFLELAGAGWSTSPAFRTALTALTARANAVAAGRDVGPVTSRVRTAGGHWLALHASRQPLDGSPAVTVVVVGPATSGQVAPILVDAYGLTPRESEVTRALARGLTNADIARELHLSPHTVRDHLKAVFGKLDVASRGELVARLFADLSVPAIEAPGTHVGW